MTTALFNDFKNIVCSSFANNIKKQINLNIRLLICVGKCSCKVIKYIKTSRQINQYFLLTVCHYSSLTHLICHFHFCSFISCYSSELHHQICAFLSCFTKCLYRLPAFYFRFHCSSQNFFFFRESYLSACQ